MPTEFMGRYSERSRDVLAAMLDQSQDCVKLIATDGTLEYMNANGQAAMQLGDFETISGKHWVELWPEESRERLSLGLAEALAGGKARFEGYCPTKDGDPRWWDVSVSPIRDRDGTITHALATSRDITRQVAERKEERIRRENAERAQIASEDVASEMRHRMKNLLAVVGSISRIMAREGGSAEDQSRRMQDKLDALATAQDLVASHHEQPVPLATALRTIVSAGGVRRSVEFAQIDDIALEDRTIQQLALLIHELETNSLKYGALHEEGGKVGVTALDGGNVIDLTWEELGAHDVAEPDHESAGLRLLRRLGAAQFDWHEDGVTVRLAIPR